MKNSFYTLFILLLLAGITWFLKVKNNSNSWSDKDFAVADTAAIDKIFLADKAGHQLLLERQSSGKWHANKHFLVRNDVLQNLLVTIHNMAVKMPVPMAGHNHVVAQLAATGIKTELYRTGKLFKTYYIGGPTQDLLGTYMLLENSKRAYVMHIPGFNGYLSTRFSLLEEIWKERFLFKVPVGSMKSIQVVYPQSPQTSFTLNAKTGNVKNEKVHRSDTLPAFFMLQYIRKFEYMPFEGWAKSFSFQQKDSLLNTDPFAVIRIVSTTGIVNTVRFFTIKNDPERMYAVTKDSTFLLVQHFVLDSVLLRYPKIPGLGENIYQQPK